MSEVIVSSILSFRGIDHVTKEELRKRYTFTPRVPPGTPRHVRPLSISLCSSYKDFFNVPRDMSLLEQISATTTTVIADAQDTPSSPRDPPPIFRGELDPSRNQTEAVKKCLDLLNKNPLGGGCLLSLPPGFGKTACALYVSSKIATRTLILVHTTVLAHQWKSRVETFLENATVKIVASKSVGDIPADVTHVIVLLQTVLALKKRGELAWLRHLHDLMIVDECHHVVARTLCQVVETVGCRYRLGLSATIARKDGLDSMLQALLGPVAYQCERHDSPNLTVHALQYVSKTPTEAETFVQCLHEIVIDEDRQDMLAQTLLELYAQGRHVIVLSDRLQQLHAFQRFVQEQGIPTYMAIGGSTGDPDMDKRPLVLATYSYASEGLDLPSLNTCLLASPRVEVKQSVGRILRAAGSFDPLVVDIVDLDKPILKRQFNKRKMFYTKALHEGGLAAALVFVSK